MSQSALLFAVTAGGAHGATPTLAPGLKMDLPSSLVVEVVHTQGQVGGPILVGEIAGAPGYFMAAVRIDTWERDTTLWGNLEKEIRKRNRNDKVTIHARGSFTTATAGTVMYRVYEYGPSDAPHRQGYFLLRGDESAYWIIVTAVEGVDLELVLPIAKALIRRAQPVDGGQG